MTNTNSQDKPIVVGFDVSPDKPLAVQVSMREKEKEGLSKRRINIIIFFGLLIVSGVIIYMKYVPWKNPPKVQNILTDLSLTYIAPKYLSEGDQNVIDISITNLNLNESFSGTITLIFHDPTIPFMSIPDKNLSLVIKDLRPDDRVTGQFKFTLPTGSSIDKAVYYFQVYKPDGTPYTSPNGTLYKSNEEEFLIAPIPYLRSFLAWLIGGGGLGILISLRDQLKKLLGFE